MNAMTAGILISVFIYWGWDTAVTVNEESKDSTRTPGLAAVLSTVILLVIYVVTTFAAQAVHGAGFLVDNADDVLWATGTDMLGSFFDKFLIIAVLTSAAASCQTTILPSARTMLSMGAHKAAPDRFAKIHPKFLTPSYSTWFFGIAAVVWYLIPGVGRRRRAGGLDRRGRPDDRLLLRHHRLRLCGVLLAAPVQERQNFIFVGLFPFLGSLSLTWIFVKSLIDLADPENSESGSSWFGLGPPFVIGGVLLIIGMPLMFLWKAGHPSSSASSAIRHT